MLKIKQNDNLFNIYLYNMYVYFDRDYDRDYIPM